MRPEDERPSRAEGGEGALPALPSKRGVGRALLHGPLARVVTLPGRIGLAGGRTIRVAAESARWLVTSREHTNFTYELSELNREHLAWFVAHVSGCARDDVHRLYAEMEGDEELHDVVRAATGASSRRRVADREIRWHRHLGWYALTRLLKPQHVVETGTDKGLGSLVLAAALRRNGSGRVTTIDVAPDRGYLITPPYDAVIDQVVDDSLAVLGALGPVDLFIHDSLHTREHESAELGAVAPHLTEGALVLSDNSELTDALPTWASETGRTFLYWQEQPERHWYPGGGIGAAWTQAS